LSIGSTGNSARQYGGSSEFVHHFSLPFDVNL
jgi:hypothetical protein